jgi:D-alanyl-lipoteichoic acid acyltransferase DltB (MBOAT superfamily)
MVFYGWWDVRFLGVLCILIAIDYVLAIKVENSKNVQTSKILLILSIMMNLGVLAYFKYYNFFIDSIGNLSNLVGVKQSFWQRIEIVLPLGISFFIFQKISYVVDVYKGSCKAEKNLLDFALYVLFFPQLVAGPIMRANDLLSQVKNRRIITVKNLWSGLFLICIGLFKKVFVADNLAPFVERAFSLNMPGGGVYISGIYAFAAQIYCDFSGYSDIACGTSLCMGFNLMRNFNMPYFSLSIKDFWHRWHISLSTWLRDYLYIPLGGNRKGRVRTFINLLATMTLGGLWHGASWTFIIWGLFHGTLLSISRISKIDKNFLYNIADNRAVRTIQRFTAWFVTFHLVMLGWIFFRAPTFQKALIYIHNILSIFQGNIQGFGWLWVVAFYAGPLFLIEICITQGLKPWVRYPVLKLAGIAIMVYSLVYFGGKQSAFIYFQF